MGAQALLRCHVDVRPEVRVRADLDHRRVERAVVGADVAEALEVAGVAAVVDPVLLAGDHPGGPEGVLGVAQRPAAEVAGRGGGQGEAADPRRVVPVQFAQAVLGDAPVLQVRADAEGHGEQGVRAGQLLDRGQVQVVVVVVGDHDGVDRAERGQRQGRGVQPLGSGEGERRAALTPHGVEQDPVTVDLREHSGVAHPGQAQPRGGRAGDVGEGGRVHRYAARGGAADPGVPVEVELQHVPPRAREAAAGGAARVLEHTVLEVRGSADAGHALTARVHAEDFGPQGTRP